MGVASVRSSIWRKAIPSAAGIMVLFGWMLPASAHWQNTKWGMSRAQAKAAIKGAIEDCTIESSGCLYRFPYASGELNFNGTMSFEAGRLSEVMLFPEAGTQTADVLTALTTKYGKPRDSNDGDLHRSVWRDKEDVITLFWINPFASGEITGVNVSYRPISKTNASGL